MTRSEDEALAKQAQNAHVAWFTFVEDRFMGDRTLKQPTADDQRRAQELYERKEELEKRLMSLVRPAGK
jgi:hypothetical protein